VAALLLCAGLSCGGPYTSKKIDDPEQKLELANKLFDRRDYKAAAVEYKSFLASFAGDERSDFAQFRIAESYRLSHEFLMASVEYRILINDFGYSEYVDDAFYLEGLCSFMLAPAAERDQTRSYEALSKINRFLQIFQDSPRREEALQTRTEIYERLGKKSFKNGKLYYSRKYYSSALIYFEKVVNEFPGTEWTGKSYYFQGLIHQRRGDMEKAAVAYRASLAVGVDFSEMHDARRRLENIERSGEEQ
jgi:outer membrane protein assembly factor BamD